jgi:hypothetical protein
MDEHTPPPGAYAEGVGRNLFFFLFLSVFNSLTPKSVPAGTKNSHKHPYHDGAVFLSCGMVLMDEHTPPPGAYAEGVGQGRRRRILVESIK